MRPFAVVDGDGFRGMLTAFNPEYKIKSRNTYHSMANRVYKDTLTKLKVIMAGVSNLSITTDMWSSNAQESYISITAHWLDDDLKMQNAVLKTEEMAESHTGVHLKARIEACLGEFGILLSAVVATVADNGSNIVCALNLIEDVPRFGCFAHTLQLGIKSGLKISTIKTINRFCIFQLLPNSNGHPHFATCVGGRQFVRSIYQHLCIAW